MEAAALLQAYQNRDRSALRKLLIADIPKEDLYLPLQAYLKEQVEDLRNRLKAVILNPDGEAAQPFKGLVYLQQHFQQKCLNVLPSEFDKIRDEIAFEIAQAGRDLPDGYKGMAIALLRYACQINISNEKLKAQAELLLRRKEDARLWETTLNNESARRKTIRNYFIAGGFIIGLLILGVWGVNRYQQWKNKNHPVVSEREIVLSDPPRKRAEDTNEEWFENERLLAASFTLGNEYTKALKERGNVEAELKEQGFLFGNDPMSCYRSSAFDCKRSAKSITVHGDKKHDAILFLLWNNRVGRQVYIKKNTSFYVWLNTHQDVYSAVIFGKNWDDNLDNPCGGKGFFSEDVIYAPPTSNATIPKNFRSEDPKLDIRLRHEKLLPQQKVDQERFMYLMTDYK